MDADQFELRASRAELAVLASKYYDKREARLEQELAPAFRQRGYLTKPEFLELCVWKSPRTQPRCAANSPEYVEEVTRIALGTPFERLRIEVLTLLQGVSWPTASVILHFGHNDEYPILDFRALWTLGVDRKGVYDFEFWEAYTVYCRRLAAECGMTMRDLDRALWQYSKENQG